MAPSVTLAPGVYGLDWLLAYLTKPMFARPVTTQLRTSLAAGASTTLTIKTTSGMLRVPIEDTFGDVAGGKYDLTVVWDGNDPWGPIRMTSDFIGSGLTDRLSKFMGPVRSRVEYTFVNQDTVTQNLEFTACAFNIPITPASVMMKRIAQNLNADQFAYLSAQFPEFFAGGA